MCQNVYKMFFLSRKSHKNTFSSKEKELKHLFYWMSTVLQTRKSNFQIQKSFHATVTSRTVQQFGLTNMVELEILLNFKITSNWDKSWSITLIRVYKLTALVFANCLSQGGMTWNFQPSWIDMSSHFNIICYDVN